MPRKTESAAVESYVRAASYGEKGIAAIARKSKPEPEPRADDRVVPIRADRKEVEAVLEAGSCAEIGELLLRSRFVPSALCDYRMMAETAEIPQGLQLDLVKRFVELAGREESGRESKPNRTGLGMLVATAIGTIAGLGEWEFIAGVAASAVAACFYWRKIEKKLDANRDLAIRILASERLTCADAREALKDYVVGLPSPEALSQLEQAGGIGNPRGEQ